MTLLRSMGETVHPSVWERGSRSKGTTKKMPGESMGIVKFTTCILEESRQAQHTLCQEMTRFFESLLLPDKLNRPLVRQKRIASTELLPCEVSRIELEGYIGSTSSSTGRRQGGYYVLLGSVSNTTDYMSRAFNIRCGGTQGVDHVHVVHGVCSCLLYTSPSPRDLSTSRMPSSA